jgi:endoglucanase
MELKEIFKELSATDGPSGFEGAAGKRVVELLTPFVDEIKSDAMGNVLGYKSCGRAGAKRLLLDAHIDEVGFVVTGIEEGFLKISDIGRPDIRNMPASQVKVLTEPPIYGIVGCMPVHTLSADEMNKNVKLDDLCIDIGMNDEEAKKKVPLGTPLVFNSEFQALGDGSFCGKAFDDRACMAIIIDALSKLQGAELDVDLIIMGSVQEELGSRGAVTGTYGVCPDYALVVDVTYGKTHDYKKSDAFSLGGGPAIGVGPSISRSLSNRLISLAKEKELAYQTEVMGGDSGTNAWDVQISREGVATAVISLPLKYMHTPIETFMLSDAEAVSELIAAFVLTLKGGEL